MDNSPIHLTRLPLALLCAFGTAGSLQAQEGGTSFVEDFESMDSARWYVADGWANGEHQNCTWSKDQVEVSGGTLRLDFTKRETGDRAYACGEIQTKKRFGYGTYEARIKAAAGSGMNTAFFTYIGPVHDQPWDEIDFEFLGKDPSKVQLNQYISGKGGNEKFVPVPGGANEDFNDYAFVWEEGRIRWFINGELVHEVSDPVLVPTHASKIYLSLWASDNMSSWLGSFEPPEGTLSAYFERVAFTAAGDDCQFPESVVCALD
ncbi:glycoside hydrolase family 16 protein [Chelativorans salis]|uniref:Beta-glucanase n=1 Tax=Chelativorans salis TaxID=2978478 RepID=A0ABT2LWS6_9HYPH|nr:glycoside hydrolase family 16 protein [Chelativorans sp. EGI FJ00035]MCT7377838.1 glycoside hydrolase family 16 protein [Chelativorans sp. EGI FJ00035]